MTEYETPYAILNNDNLITTYIDRIIQKELEYQAIFGQFADLRSLGQNNENSPADFRYEYIKKTSKGFEINETRPGAEADVSVDAYERGTGEIAIYSGRVDYPYELKKLQKWNIVEDVLTDMAEQAALDFDYSIGVFMMSNVTDVAEANADTLTFPDDIITLKNAVYTAHKRKPDTLLIATDIEDQFWNLDQFIDASKYGNNTPLLRGEIGMLFGLRIVTSPLLNAGAITVNGTSYPDKDTMFCLRRAARPVRVEHWSPLYRYYSWYNEDIHTYSNELRAFYDIRLFDDTAIRQMKITV